MPAKKETKPKNKRELKAAEKEKVKKTKESKSAPKSKLNLFYSDILVDTLSDQYFLKYAIVK